MSINRLYSIWQNRIAQLRPRERRTRVRNMAGFITGIFQSGSVQLAKVARKIPFRRPTSTPSSTRAPRQPRSARSLRKRKLLSATRRLERVVDNPKIRVREWYDPTARDWLAYIARTAGTLRLIADGTKVGFDHQLLMVAVVFHRRAIPICWTWIPAARGHSSACKQLALLNHVRSLLPSHAAVVLVGDSEFGAVDVMRQLEAWHWVYVLRQKANNQIHWADEAWQDFGAVLTEPGQSHWLGGGRLTKEHDFPVHLLAHWAQGEAEPWLLATNLTERTTTLAAYGYRMRIEELFGDLKRQGFDLETTHLRQVARLSRLTLAVALLYVWLMEVGRKTIKNGLRAWVDRTDRRDLSMFQIGLRWIDWCLTNELSIGFHCTLGFKSETVG